MLVPGCLVPQPPFPQPPGRHGSVGWCARDVLWEVHVGHTWRHGLEAVPHPTEPLWALLESMEQDLQDMQAVHHCLRARESRNRLREPTLRLAVHSSTASAPM